MEDLKILRALKISESREISAIGRRTKERISPEALVEDCGLERLLRFFEDNGAEVVVLGCTHFPYVREALQARTSLPVLDPAEWLAELVLGD